MAVASRPLSSALHVHSIAPLCAGPDPGALVGEYLTGADLHFVRNHGDVPNVNESTYRLRVDGLVDEPLELSLAALTSGFEHLSVTTTLQCAGNRRAELDRIEAFHDQVLWGGDAVSTAVWTGVRLADILASARVATTATHVLFEGLDRVVLPDETTIFGASIDLDRARAADVIVAFEMNGERLPVLHGAPLRVVVPGYIGARSVKWLSRIVLSDRPSDNHFQAVSYLSETKSPAGLRLPIEQSQLNSFISVPGDGAPAIGPSFGAAGYATPSGGYAIDSVEVCVDGADWETAELLDVPEKDVWVRWQVSLKLEPGDHRIAVRACDTSGAMQPEDLAARWNPKGYMNDAWHTIVIRVEAEPA